MAKFSKKDIEHKIKEFFNNISEKTSEEVKKIKKLGMTFNIRLNELRKHFCKKCNAPCVPGVTCEVRIKNKMKNVHCKVCGNKNRWKLSKK